MTVHVLIGVPRPEKVNADEVAAYSPTATRPCRWWRAVWNASTRTAATARSLPTPSSPSALTTANRDEGVPRPSASSRRTAAHGAGTAVQMYRGACHRGAGIGSREVPRGAPPPTLTCTMPPRHGAGGRTHGRGIWRWDARILRQVWPSHPLCSGRCLSPRPRCSRGWPR